MTENASSFTEDDLISLGRKLAGLDLTEPERAALAGLISDDDVVGFGRARFDLAAGIRVGFRLGVKSGGRHGVRVPKPDDLGIDGDFGPATEFKPGRF